MNSLGRVQIISIFAILLFAVPVHAQDDVDEDKYYFHTNIANVGSLTISKEGNGLVKVVSTNPEETAIFEKYEVYEFKPAFPNTMAESIQNVYTIVTNRVELLGALMYNFPKKYTRIDQYYPNEGPFYPNDYGTTSPVENLGRDLPLYDLDLINAPGAWGITMGSPKVVIGISDSKIDSTNADMKGRVSNYLKYFNVERGLTCTHGTNVAGISIASANNAYGRPGICSGCDVVANGYGSFSYVEDLVAAGAKVINTSWAVCTMGPYHENIETRINELYDDGIIIVAGAGNSKDCNPNDDYGPDDYAYPASFEKVISVTGVFSKYNNPGENTFIGKEGYPATSNLKDRHSREYRIMDNGRLRAKYHKWDMQFNESIDICAPASTFLLGADACDDDNIYGGATSATAPFVTGTIGLMWSVNYCLTSYEIESILKLTAAEIEHLNGNQIYKNKLGAGRLDSYKAVKMSRDMREPMGTVTVSDRDFHRFNFKLETAPYDIVVKNQTFRDSASVDFKARNSIVLKPNTVLRPDRTASIKLSVDGSVQLRDCESSPPKYYERIIPRPNENANVPDRFSVTFNEATDQIEVKPSDPDIKSRFGITYSVTVQSPQKVVLHRSNGKYPDASHFEISPETGTYNVIVTFSGKREIYKLEVN